MRNQKYIYSKQNNSKAFNKQKLINNILTKIKKLIKV